MNRGAISIDWTLFARYAAPVAALFVGALLNRLLERRAKLVSYVAHASAFSVDVPAGERLNVFTHSVVVRNAGRKSAQNVRLGHNLLPNFSVYPSVPYEVINLPGGGRELHFPILVPSEQVTIAYLYFPPVTWDQINSYTKSDEGLARIIRVLPTPQLASWLRRLIIILVATGAATVVYAVIRLGAYLYP